MIHSSQIDKLKNPVHQHKKWQSFQKLYPQWQKFNTRYWTTTSSSKDSPPRQTKPVKQLDTNIQMPWNGSTGDRDHRPTIVRNNGERQKGETKKISPKNRSKKRSVQEKKQSEPLSTQRKRMRHHTISLPQNWSTTKKVNAAYTYKYKKK